MVSELGKGPEPSLTGASLLLPSPLSHSLSLPRRMRRRTRNGIGKFASGGERYLWAEIEAVVVWFFFVLPLPLFVAALAPCRLFWLIFGAVDFGAVEHQ